MADAAARREARRKRILENSQNRLQLISGKSSDDNLKEPTNASPIPQIYENTFDTITTESSTSKNSFVNGGLAFETESFESLLSRPGIAAGDGDIQNELISPTPSTTPQIQKPFWHVVIAYKYDIVLLSLLLQFLYALSAIPIENTYLFIPLIVYGITKQIWFPKQNNSNIANVLILLSGMSPNANLVPKVLNISSWIGAISQDACVFLFTTICTQSFCILIKDKLFT